MTGHLGNAEYRPPTGNSLRTDPDSSGGDVELLAVKDPCGSYTNC